MVRYHVTEVLSLFSTCSLQPSSRRVERAESAVVPSTEGWDVRDGQTMHVSDMCLLLDEEIHYIYATSGFERSRSYGSSTVSRRKLDMRRRPTRPWSALTGSIYNHSSTKNLNLEFCYQLTFPGRQQKISSAESILK